MEDPYGELPNYEVVNALQEVGIVIYHQNIL